MKSLPPAGWGDVATKQDLENLSLRFDAKLAEEIGKVRGAQTWQTITILVAILVAMLGEAVLPRWFSPPPPPAPPPPQIIVPMPGISGAPVP